VSTYEKADVKIPTGNFPGLCRLCSEFGVKDLRVKLSELRHSQYQREMDGREEHSRTRGLQEWKEENGTALTSPLNNWHQKLQQNLVCYCVH
jgi:hypothetical protein